MSDRLSIAVLEDGPLKVSNATTASYCGAPLAVSGDLYICRCGGSANPPFCDGTHRRDGFSGACEAPPDAPLVTWEGRTVRTVFNPNACMHVFYCKPLKELRARELAGDDAAASEIARVVGTCPSGALTWEAKTEIDPGPSPERGPQIEIMEGGEVRVQGAFDIDVPLLEHQREGAATLCRCGLSANKPWCDGRHRKRRDFR